MKMASYLASFYIPRFWPTNLDELIIDMTIRQYGKEATGVHGERYFLGTAAQYAKVQGKIGRLVDSSQLVAHWDFGMVTNLLKRFGGD